MPNLALDQVYTSTDAAPLESVRPPMSSASVVSNAVPVLYIMGLGSVGAASSFMTLLDADHATPIAYAYVDSFAGTIRDDLLLELRPHIEMIKSLIGDMARARDISVTDVTVSKFVDPDEQSEEIVITQHVCLRADAALAYWDEAGAAVAQWTGSLPAEEAARVTRSVAVAVRWTDA
jgi:hypothetical protein